MTKERRQTLHEAMRDALIALALLLAAPALGQSPPDIAGRAVAQDGDTIVVAGRVVRLQGIDAPEIGQSCEDAQGRPWRCGRDAAFALDRMIDGQLVTCAIDPRDPADRYGRALGWCRTPREALSPGLAREGWAVAYRRYLDYPEGDARAYKAALLAAEAEARVARRGIWQGRFDLPETWRRANAGRRSMQ